MISSYSCWYDTTNIVAKNMEAINALAKVFSIPVFDRSSYYRMRLKDDLAWIDALHERATEESVKAFLDVLLYVDELVRTCTIPCAVIRAANAMGLVPEKGATLPCFEIGRDSSGKFLVAKDVSGNIIMADTNAAAQRKANLGKRQWHSSERIRMRA